MRTLIIGDGLSNEILGSNSPHCNSRLNVGNKEIHRLLGSGRSYGEGPLSIFLRAAQKAATDGCPIQTLFLRRKGSEGSEADVREPASEFVEPIRLLAEQATVVLSEPNTIPWADLQGACLERGGITSGPADGPRILIVGCHTEGTILALANFLKCALGYSDIAICSHLVGSATPEAHFATLRQIMPSMGIKVLLDLEEAASYVGMDRSTVAPNDCRACVIEPEETRVSLEPSQKRIIELLCMHWTRVKLRPLAGGFSGSLLFLADGWIGEAKTEPMVIKVDGFSQMRRELDGYHLVKDFFGKHVPTFGCPVTDGEWIGVGMELAAMEGSPQTLQDTFEEAEDEGALGKFFLQMDKALQLLSEKLYSNTCEKSWIVPYRTFGLHAEQQVVWLRENADIALSYLKEDFPDSQKMNPKRIEKILRLLGKNEDGIESEVCLSHGDLNCANTICDEANNVWFIDWTHSGIKPLELDFAKLENDVKYVMSKQFDVEDLPRLKKFEEFLLDHRIPTDTANLPESVKFARWDLRFQKILGAVKRIRESCFALKDSEDWLAYRVALLQYALHTMSFDKKRGRGECNPVQLMHALYAVEGLVYNLVADDFHLRIRAEKPNSYPSRQRISIDEAPWIMDCENYEPPYHVETSVLAQDYTRIPGGWADPEDVTLVKDDSETADTVQRDEMKRPLNPRGRTGIAGRGLLGRWGCNLSVAVVFVRRNEEADQMEILLGRVDGEIGLHLPYGIVMPGEDSSDAALRVLMRMTSWTPPTAPSEVVFEGYTYDSRQTDHAWVETRSYLCDFAEADVPGVFKPQERFDEIKWWPLVADTVNSVPSGQARFIRDAAVKLVETQRIDQERADALLAGTG